MAEVVVFNGLNTLDFHEVRSHVVRIPEVTIRLRQAQKVVDQVSEKPLDLMNTLVGSDSHQWAHSPLKNLLVSIVQVGLFDRYVRMFKLPHYIVGPTSSDSALLTCIGHQRFEVMVSQSPVFQEAPVNDSLLPAGDRSIVKAHESLHFVSFAGNETQPGVYEHMDLGHGLDLKTLVRRLMEEFGVESIINIGPGANLMNRGVDEIWLENAMISESIDMDPMLNWFWPGIKQAELHLAN